MNRGAARSDVFLHDRDRIEFGRLLGEAHDRFDIEIHAYCLMSNHYHLLLSCPRGGLAEAMQLIGGVYARHLNDRLGRDGPVFRGRYFGRLVDSPDYQLNVVRYIHRNPLAFLPIDRLESYRWSSLRTYLGFRRAPDWLRTDIVADAVGGAHGMRSLVGDAATGQRGAPAGAGEVAWAIDLMIDEHLGGGASQGVGRTMMSELLGRVDGATAREISGLLSFPSANAERSARSRARRRVQQHPALQRAVQGALELVA